MANKPTLHLSERTEPDPNYIACPSCGERLPTLEKKEAWVQVHLESDWVAWYRLVLRKGRPVVAEVRVLPNDQHRSDHATWSEDPEAVPADGVSGTALRSLRVTHAIGLFKRFIKGWEKLYGTETTERVFGRFGFSIKGSRVERRPGRGGRPDLFYATWAAAYVQSVANGSRHPVTDLAVRPPVKIEGFGPSDDADAVATVRAIVQEARRRELLTRGPAGKAGGELTEKALATLGLISERTQGRDS